MADFGNRGVLDAVVANQNGPLLFYRNTVAPGNHWIEFDLEGRPATAVRSAPRSACSGMARSRFRKSPVAADFCAQNQRRLHFGLGKAAAVDRVEIRWPSGKTQTIAGSGSWIRSIK